MDDVSWHVWWELWQQFVALHTGVSCHARVHSWVCWWRLKSNGGVDQYIIFANSLVKPHKPILQMRHVAKHHSPYCSICHDSHHTLKIVIGATVTLLIAKEGWCETGVTRFYAFSRYVTFVCISESCPILERCTAVFMLVMNVHVPN